MKNLIENFKKAYSNNSENLERALRELRNTGASQKESVKVVMSALKISLKEADTIVLNSEVWKDKREENLSFREGFADFLDK